MSGGRGGEVPGRRIRVLLVGRGLGLGGMERLLVSQVRFGDRDRFEYSIAYVNPDKDDLVAELTSLGAEVHSLGDERGPWPVALRSLLAAEHFDVVHVHSPLVAAATRLAAHTVRPVPRLVYTEHNSWGPYSVPTRWANRLTYSLDDAQIAVSNAAWQSVPMRRRGRLEVLHHGIDVEHVARATAQRPEARERMGVSPEEILIGTVANLRPEKNYPGLLRVAQKVTESRAGVRFVSIGQGPLAEEIGRLHSSMGLGDRFLLMGRQPDATSLMAGFDVFVLASTWEGLPVAVMEARALGLPVVSTAVGGLVDAVEHGVDGLLVPAGQDDALVSALLQLVDDGDLRATMSAASRVAAANFDARDVAVEVERRYVRSPVLSA